MKKLLMVMNPNAGTRQGKRWMPEIVDRLEKAGYLCTCYLTRRRGDAAHIVREAGGNADMILACGGDGTLNEVITGMLQAGHRVQIGYIPCGSTNDFASGLGIPGEIMKACELAATGKPRKLDVGCFGEKRYFSYTASFGAFTSVSYSTSQSAKNILGYAAYILEGIRSLTDIRPIHMQINADGQLFEDDYIYGGICNSTSLGGFLKLENGKVHMNDGLFEALLIPFPTDLIALNRTLTALRTFDYKDAGLTFVRAACFEITGAPGMMWTLDGEAAEAPEHFLIRNLHDAMTMVC